MAYLIDLTGKTAIVTGAAKGIGYSIASALANAGATVIVNDILPDSHVVSQMQKLGEASFYIQSDISTEEGADELINKAVGLTGRLDILINNAGVVADWDKSWEVNVKGAYFCSESAIRLMENGKIILISSTSAETGSTGYPQYVATKGAINSLIRYLARTYGEKGIQVNGVAPAAIKSDMLQARYENEEAMEKHYIPQIPIRRMGTPEDIANIVLFFASDLSGYIHGEIITADGGRMRVGQ